MGMGWQCPKCRFQNYETRVVCHRCALPRPGAPPARPEGVSPSGDASSGRCCDATSSAPFG
eukprot:394804-Prorocentrum_lima.AAC.1